MSVKEKKAFLVLYMTGLIMALLIFLYLTRIAGYTTKEFTKVAFLIYLPVLVFIIIGSAFILKKLKTSSK